MSGEPAIVIDNGSYKIRAGISEFDEPTACFPTVVGRKQHEARFADVQREFYVGDGAVCQKFMNLYSPYQNGILTNFDDMETIWHHAIYNELRVSAEDHPVLLSEPIFFEKQNREKTLQVFMETFNVPSFYLLNDGLMALIRSGKTTGIVLQSGENFTSVIPIYEGAVISNAALRINLAGKALTQDLGNVLNCQYISLDDNIYIFQAIKNSLCYVALDYEQEIKNYEQSDANYRHYELPDGHFAIIQNQRFRCPELLFKKKIIGLEVTGIHELIFKSIMNFDSFMRREYYSNICLAGGTTMLPGFKERLHRELTMLAPPSMKISIDADPQRDSLVWRGGSALASYSFLKSLYIKREEYDEAGPPIVHRKCIPML